MGLQHGAVYEATGIARLCMDIRHVRRPADRKYITFLVELPTKQIPCLFVMDVG